MVCCELCQRDTGAGAKLAVESVWEVSRLQRSMKMEMTYPVMPIVFLSAITAGWLQVLGGGGGGYLRLTSPPFVPAADASVCYGNE